MVSSREFYCFALGNLTGLGLAILQSRRQGCGVVFGVIGHGLLNEILLLFSLEFYWSLQGIYWSRLGNFTAPAQRILLLSSTEFYCSPLCTKSYWSRFWNFTGLLYGILLVSFRAFWGFVQGIFGVSFGEFECLISETFRSLVQRIFGSYTRQIQK